MQTYRRNTHTVKRAQRIKLTHSYMVETLFFEHTHVQRHVHEETKHVTIEGAYE